MSLNDTLCCASEMLRPFSSGLRYSRSAKISRGDIFVGPDEVADSQGKGRIFGYRKRIDTKAILEPRHQDGKGQRVEAGFVQRQIIFERRERDLLLVSNLLH